MRGTEDLTALRM